MTTDRFILVFANRDLKDHVKTESKRYTSDREIQRELEQEAWLRICAEPTGQKSTECYQEQAAIAINTAYMREYRNRKAEHHYRTFRAPFYYTDRYQ